MRNSRASLTAAGVAWARGVGNEASPPDPLAPLLLRGPARLSLRWVPRLQGLHWAARLLSAGMVDHVNLRTHAIDAVIEQAVQLGCRQLVVLGAGLDARAWRMPVLAGVDVFEVDHPATQRRKRAAVGGLATLARSVHFAPIDFERDRLTQCLANSGHVRDQPTMWVWEGVTPYLEPRAISQTLRDIAAASAPESTLAMTYARRPLGPLESVVLDRAIELGFASLGEPLRGAMSPTTASAHIEAVGWALVHDSDQDQWGSDTHRLARRIATAFRAERLLVARAP